MKDLKSWLDERNMSPDEAGEFFGKAAGTIRNWRSKGVPEPLQDWISKRASEYEGTKIRKLPDRLSLEYSPDQFDRWNQAALDQGMLTRDWAVQCLDNAAQESERQGISDSRHASVPLLRENENSDDTKSGAA